MNLNVNRSSVVFAAFAVLAACEQTDLNQPCILVRRNPDGGSALPLLKSDPVVKNSANKDFISFGSPGCEDQVCVRDSAFQEADDGGVAGGYCSRACAADTTAGCPSYSGALDSDAKTKLSCRPLVLDENTLAAIKAKDPDTYQRVFGMTMSPYFCARSAVVPDAGQP